MSNQTTNSFPEQHVTTDEVSFDLDNLLSAEPTPTPENITGVVIGRVAGQSVSGDPLVDYPHNPAGRPVPAQTLAELQPTDIGREAALMFQDGDPRRPILMGLIHTLMQDDQEETSQSASPGPSSVPVLNIMADNERVEIKADKEIVLRCGKASITLTRAGKVLIRGAFLLSRSWGVNRIKGGSVQIN